MFGKEMDIPGLTAWYGDENKSYTYSGIKMNPDKWNESLLLTEVTQRTIFNSKTTPKPPPWQGGGRGRLIRELTFQNLLTVFLIFKNLNRENISFA